MRVERSRSSSKTRGRPIASQDVTLPADGEPATARVRFTLADAGPRVLHFRIPVLDGEQVAKNNEREALVTVVDRREKILYIEGQPRPEMKFLRQAVADDKNLQIVTLQRSADRKFLRLDIDAADDLAGGFPKTREELYAYRGIIVGSIEASAFTQDQLQMMADFVSLRGGGLLALGGRRSFTEGGYAGTPLAEALPVQLDAAKAADDFLQTLTVLPTRLGQTHVATQVGATEQASAESLGDAAAGDDRESDSSREAGRGGAPDRARRRAATARSCSPTSGTAPARPSPSRSRTRGCGRCTRTSRSRTRRTRRSGGGCSAGSWTARRSA